MTNCLRALPTKDSREMRSFPVQDAIHRAYDMGARRLIVHYGDWEPALHETVRQRAAKASGLREVAAFGQDVYELDPPGTS